MTKIDSNKKDNKCSDLTASGLDGSLDPLQDINSTPTSYEDAPPSADSSQTENSNSASSKRKKTIICPFCYREQKVVKNSICTNQECYSYKKGIILPDEVFTHELFPIVIVGATGSGKSHFLATLKHRLVNETLWEDYWRWSFVSYYNPNNRDKQQLDNPFINYEIQLYENNKTLYTTQAAGDHPPLLLSLKYRHPIKHIFQEPYLLKKNLLIAFTDTAGEHSQNESVAALEENYPALKLAKGIIVMVDPNELESETSPANTVISSFKGSSPKSKTPFALCLTKLDKFSHLTDLEIQGWLDSKNSNTKINTSGFLHLSNIERNSREISDWLEKKKNSLNDLIQNVNKVYKYSAFFAVSALGVDPFKEDNKEESSKSLRGKPSPLRVLDPLLWILWQHGKLNGK